MSKPQQASPRIPNHKCCGVVGESESETRKNRQRPQPWVIRKIWIPFTLGIMGYSGYAYIARLCLPMIKRTHGALGSRATGSVLFDLIHVSYAYRFFGSCTIDLLQYSILVDDLGLCQGSSHTDEKTSLNPAFLQVILTSPGYARDVSSIRHVSFLSILI